MALSRSLGWLAEFSTSQHHDSTRSDNTTYTTLPVDRSNAPATTPTTRRNRDSPELELELELEPPTPTQGTESVLSIALSVALVGTALGYTAYRLWRDRNKSTTDIDTKKQEEVEATREGIDHDVGGKPKNRNRLAGSRVEDHELPPPPYRYRYREQDEDKASTTRCHHRTTPGTGTATRVVHEHAASDSWSRPRSHQKRCNQGGCRSGSQSHRTIMPQMQVTNDSDHLHRKLVASSMSMSTPSKRAQTQTRRNLTRGRRVTKILIPSPLLKAASSRFKFKDSNFSKENVETAGGSGFEAQLDRMSANLQELIREGQRALEKDVVLTEGEDEELTASDDDEEDWIDEDIDEDEDEGEYEDGDEYEYEDKDEDEDEDEDVHIVTRRGGLEYFRGSSSLQDDRGDSRFVQFL